MKYSWNIKNFPKVTTFKCCFYTRTPSQSCHRVLLSFRTLPYRNRCISSDLTIFPPTNTRTVSVVLRWFLTPSFWRWNPNAPSPGLRQRHAWTFRNSRSAKPDLKCPGRISHFMILDSCLSVQSQPFGDFRNHVFKKNIKMQIPSKFLEQKWQFVPNFLDGLVRSAHTSVVVNVPVFHLSSLKKLPGALKKWVITLDNNLT